MSASLDNQVATSLEQFNILVKQKESELVSLLKKAFEGHLPDGYSYSDIDEPSTMGSCLRITADIKEIGAKSISFYHRATHSTRSKDETTIYFLSSETVTVTIDVLDDREVWMRDESLPFYGRLAVPIYGSEDTARAVSNIVAHCCSLSPFTEFVWKKDQHDTEGKLHLFHFDQKMQSIWKSGREWATLAGDSYAAKHQAKRAAEVHATHRIKSTHEERLAQLQSG